MTANGSSSSSPRRVSAIKLSCCGPAANGRKIVAARNVGTLLLLLGGGLAGRTEVAAATAAGAAHQQRRQSIATAALVVNLLPPSTAIDTAATASTATATTSTATAAAGATLVVLVERDRLRDLLVAPPRLLDIVEPVEQVEISELPLRGDIDSVAFITVRIGVAGSSGALELAGTRGVYHVVHQALAELQISVVSFVEHEVVVRAVRVGELDSGLGRVGVQVAAVGERVAVFTAVRLQRHAPQLELLVW
mmetsp:Transcript_46666/g.114459  ORF Transcript_46666/g.114459 Transcript_46666/m.114459 type:complete len:250 (-) Transcript_46666:735-1484(-)